MIKLSRMNTLNRTEGWLRGLDLNQRPLGYEPNELPDCSTPRIKSITTSSRRIRSALGRSCSPLPRSRKTPPPRLHPPPSADGLQGNERHGRAPLPPASS